MYNDFGYLDDPRGLRKKKGSIKRFGKLAVVGLVMLLLVALGVLRYTSNKQLAKLKAELEGKSSELERLKYTLNDRWVGVLAHRQSAVPFNLGTGGGVQPVAGF